MAATLLAGQSAPPARPTCDATEFHHFDFWQGDWEVKSAGKTVGYSRIEKAVQGCLLMENWSGVDGDTGKSLNFFDRRTSEWRQVYVGPEWNLSYRGTLRDNAMVFRSQTGATRLRLTFTPLENHEVRQHKERSSDGMTWTTVYDFRYIPRRDPPPAIKSKAACQSGPARQFDFWAGEWDVYSGKTLAGTNRIERAVGDCLLIENWTGARGGEGKSFNFYDTASKEWRQIWVAPGGPLELHGVWSDGALRYTGTTPRRDGSHIAEQLTFTPLPEGRVRQFWEQSTDGGKTWTVAFDGTYVPRGSQP